MILIVTVNYMWEDFTRYDEPCQWVPTTKQNTNAANA